MEIRKKSGLGKKEVSKGLKSLRDLGLIYDNPHLKSTTTGYRNESLYYIHLKYYDLILHRASELYKEYSQRKADIWAERTDDNTPASKKKNLKLKEGNLRKKARIYLNTELLFTQWLMKLGSEWEREQIKVSDNNRPIVFIDCLSWSPALADIMRFAKQIEPYCRSPEMALQAVFELEPHLYKKHLSWQLDDPSLPLKKARLQSNAMELSWILYEYLGEGRKGDEFQVEHVEWSRNKTIDKIIKCPFFAKAKMMNSETSFDSCKAYCRASVDGLNPKYTHRFTKAMCKGDPYCESIIERIP